MVNARGGDDVMQCSLLVAAGRGEYKGRACWDARQAQEQVRLLQTAFSASKHEWQEERELLRRRQGELRRQVRSTHTIRSQLTAYRAPGSCGIGDGARTGGFGADG